MHDGRPEIAPPSLGDVEMVEFRPGGALAGVVSRMTGYRETTRRHMRQTEPASLTIPLIISFGEPFAIGLGRAPRPDDAHDSFAAGLFAGPVVIESSGASHCLQIDFAPLGARRFFRLPMHELAGRMVALDAVLGQAGMALRERLGNETGWSERFELASRFVQSRIADAPAPAAEIAWAFSSIAMSGGARPISSVARETGWSRKHLANRFAREFGLSAKSVSRIVRINRAIRLARIGTDGWADIAADCGFADQAHLAREFRDLAGETPVSWAGRLA